jgi:hypothetical protein
LKLKPTHHVMFGDDIAGIAQGWRYTAVTKTGSKWTYFQLLDGTGHTYKVKNPKWESLRKKEYPPKTVDHEVVIDREMLQVSNTEKPKKRRSIKKL